MMKSRRVKRLRIILAAVALCAAFGIVAALAANGSVGYTYDALGRVVTANYDTGVCIAYAYDANGNRTAETISMVGGGSKTTWGCFTWGNANWTLGP